MRVLLLLIGFWMALGASAQTVTVGSKRFSESRLLGEILAQAIEKNTALEVKRRFGLGGTLICFKALEEGEIDLYPEYTGTGLQAILDEPYTSISPDSLYAYVRREFRDQYNLVWTAPLGFNNTYALAVHDTVNLSRISDLQSHPGLLAGFSHEFLNRSDGLPGLKEAYGIAFEKVTGLDHGLIYRAMESGDIEITDVYSTDGQLERFDLKLLEDDKQFFPPYYACPLVRSDLLKTHPEVHSVLRELAGSLSNEKIRALNYRVEVERESVVEVAADFLQTAGIVEPGQADFRWPPMLLRILEHLQLTGFAVLLAIACGVPLGMLIVRKPGLASSVLNISGVIQTIPSIALLGFFIPLLGIGFWPAMSALFLYALLPIVRNTYSGLSGIDPELEEAAIAMGMTPSQVMRRLKLPLATGFIMAGVRTATVINIGTATLAAFIGAGGLGEYIFTGITLNDNALILKGAIPAALLALVVDYLMGRLEKRWTPDGLQQDRSST
jgi:osmoprotectant transport system permease protein